MPPTVAAVPILVLAARDVAIDPSVAPPVIARPADVAATVPAVELLPDDDPAIIVVVAAPVPTAAVLAVYK